MTRFIPRRFGEIMLMLNLMKEAVLLLKKYVPALLRIRARNSRNSRSARAINFRNLRQKIKKSRFIYEGLVAIFIYKGYVNDLSS